MKAKKAIILAGGTGSRLGPLSKVTNKHLLPVGLVPMIYYPICQAICNGIYDICIVSGLNHLGAVVTLLGSGKTFGCDFTYKVQDSAGGIAEALSLCRNFSGNDILSVFLGDNIFGDILDLDVPEGYDATVFLKKVPDPHRFGIAEVDHLKKLVDIEEKPENPKGNLAVTGAYIYTPYIWDIINTISRSKRGELEISDVNRHIIKNKKVFTVELLSWWSDAGTQESYIRANKETWPNSCLELNNMIEKMIKL